MFLQSQIREPKFLGFFYIFCSVLNLKLEFFYIDKMFRNLYPKEA